MAEIFMEILSLYKITTWNVEEIMPKIISS